MNTNFPPTEKIMATPSIEPTAPLAPSPVDKEKIKLGIAPGNQWNEEGTYCNVLPPAPRNQLAANPWVNLFIGVIFIYFAFSLFGMYEIQLPESLRKFSLNNSSISILSASTPLSSYITVK